MKLEEILQKSKWNKINPDVLEFICYSDIFKKQIPFSIHFSEPSLPKIISDKTLKTINEFLEIENTELKLINDEIWNHCLACHQTTKTSADEGKTWQEYNLEDNLKESEIKSKEDALSKTDISEVYINNNLECNERIVWLMIKNDWDPEHDINFTYVDGKLDSIN